MIFRSRVEAAELLALRLERFAGTHPLVLGVPRGGVPMARLIAERLGGDLDVVLVHKLRAPLQPEFAIGSVDESGRLYLADAAREEGIPRDYIDHEKSSQLDALRARRRMYSAFHPPVNPAGRTVILVDDGIATGSTMIVAIRSMRLQHAAKVIVATAVVPPDTLEYIESEADEVVWLAAPSPFHAIGQVFDDFHEVTDEEVMAALHRVTAQEVAVTANGVTLAGSLNVPPGALGLVIFAHGSGSSRHSPRNRFVAGELQRAGLATLLLDLLTEDEERADQERGALRFDIPFLARRVVAATDWARAQPALAHLPIGYFGASTGAAAALSAAADRFDVVKAVVSRGGRPDLAAERLPEVTASTLLIVGGADRLVAELNQRAYATLRMYTEAQLDIVSGATHLFDEPGALDVVASLAARWFVRHLTSGPEAARPAGAGTRSHRAV